MSATIRRTRSTALSAATLLTIAAGPVNAQDVPTSFIELRALKVALEEAIQQAKLVSPNPPYFIIRKIGLTLQGERRVGADGTVSFRIPVFAAGVDLGAKGTQVALHRLKLELIPPESAVVGGEKAIDLAPLIRSLKQAFAEGGLRAATIEYTYRWALQLGAEGKINAVVAKVGASIADESSQEITFHMCETLNRSDCIQ
jgi:hypothetical protein